MTEREHDVRGPGDRVVGRRRALPLPKGRPVEPWALAEVRELLGDRPRRRDLLIEFLHLIQHRHRGLAPGHLAALAFELGLSMAEVFEVATFYAHFDVLDDNPAGKRPLTVRVCDSVSCSMAGSEGLCQELARAAGAGVRVVRAPCMGRCDRAPNAVVERHHVSEATPETVLAAVAEGRTEPVVPEPLMTYERYVRAGGYALLRACREGHRDRDELVAAVESSGLRGLGGAGFRSGQKWRLVRQSPGPRLMAVNADEGEPGTFKDRHHLRADPHRFLEGMLIAAWAVEAEEIYIYLRDEYPQIHLLLEQELARLAAERLVSPPAVHLRRGAGAYICGEETAMLESLEGKRGYPRQKPPFPTQVGLFGRPTLIHNVETVYWVRDILEHPPGWLASFGRNGRKGLRSYSVSGRVNDPGVKLAPAGITVRQLIDEHSGGMLERQTFKGYLPGGASGGILPAHLGDVPLDFGTLEPYGCFIGSAAVVVLSDHDDVRSIALNLMRFFADESCGQCTPCRLGTEKAAILMERDHWDEPLLTELAAGMRDASICGLGQAAPNPLLCALRYFPEDFR
jgi:NADH:ubiquinone oxidoreductase subunit F (NADH-binding)/NADH:ubiquinone oxidoreductase subunit E